MLGALLLSSTPRAKHKRQIEPPCCQHEMEYDCMESKVFKSRSIAILLHSARTPECVICLQTPYLKAEDLQPLIDDIGGFGF